MIEFRNYRKNYMKTGQKNKDFNNMTDPKVRL